MSQSAAVAWSGTGQKAFAEAHGTELWEEAQAVAGSELFHRSPRLRALLLFTAERTLGGEFDQLTEYAIGRQVFQRGPEWIPTDDSIVRSSVRQLRLKLAEYYAHEGAQRRWLIEIPKGSYILSFRPREAAETAAPVAAQAARRRPWLALGLGVLLLLSAALNVVLLSGREAGAKRMGLAAALTTQSPEPTKVVMDDFAHVLLAQMAGYPQGSAEDYANRTYTSLQLAPSQDPHLLRMWNLLTTRHIVSLGAVATLDRLLRTTPDPSRLVMVHARNMTAREFRHTNAIIVGSQPNNPWSEMFERELNFRRLAGGDGRVSFINRNPRKGEAAEYSIQRSASINSGEGYARIAYVSNHSGGFVLLLNGVNMVTAEAAGEFATDPARLPEICRLFGVESAAQLPHLEILLRTNALDNSVRAAEVAAWRRLD